MNLALIYANLCDFPESFVEDLHRDVPDNVF